MRALITIPAALMLAVGAPPVVSAQTLSGQVVDSITRATVGAGFVVLVGPDGQEVTRTLTTRDGRFTFQLQPGQLGPLRVRSERIGYRVAATEPFPAPTDGSVELVIWVQALPTLLSEIDIQEASECRMRPEASERTALVWEEARKALVAASWTASQSLYYIVADVYQRDRDRRGRRLILERHWPHRGPMTVPFVSRDPEELLLNGYVVDRGGSFDYYAPDAQVLQDQGFLETHCFRLRRHDNNQDLIGIAFEPAPSRDLPDIQGVLWLDRRSFELRSLEYEYTNLPRTLRTRSGGGGGFLEFMPLPSGAWIVHRWELEIPTAFRSELVDRFDRFPRRIADAFRDKGAEILTVTDRAGTRVYQAELADLIAIVVDSADGDETRVARAIVRIEGTWFEGATDERGIVQIRAPLDGEYGVTFSDQTMWALGYVPTSRRVTLARGQTDTLWLQVPSTTDMLEGVCGSPVTDRDFRVLVGTVMDTTTGRPVPNALVTATWQHIDENFFDARIGFQDKYATSTTDDSGYYAICGLEFARPTLVYAEDADGRSELLRVEFDLEGVEVDNEFHAMQVPFWRQNLVLEPRSPRTTLVSGIVTDAVTGRVLPNAVVTIDGGSASVDTDSSGVFHVEDLPPGRHRVTLTKPGYAARSGDVEIDANRPRIIGAGLTALTPVSQVVGAVTEPETGDPVTDVWLTLISAQGDSVAMTRSDDSGAFVLSAPEPGPYYVAARRIGYTPDITGPFQLRTGRAVDIAFPISPSAFGLEPITVTGKPAVPFLSTVGFYARQREGLGVFLDREAIERQAGASELGHLLQAVPGIRVDAAGLIRVRGIVTGANPDDRNFCNAPLVWVDGMRILPVEMGATRGGLITPNSWTQAIHPIHIEAIEVYRTPAEMPAQYNTGGDAACGVILIWTRRGGY